MVRRPVRGKRPSPVRRTRARWRAPCAAANPRALARPRRGNATGAGAGDAPVVPALRAGVLCPRLPRLPRDRGKPEAGAAESCLRSGWEMNVCHCAIEVLIGRRVRTWGLAGELARSSGAAGRGNPRTSMANRRWLTAGLELSASLGVEHCDAVRRDPCASCHRSAAPERCRDRAT